jgi:cytosine/adenosine deaminase-related metal-dependent hydrolase
MRLKTSCRIVVGLAVLWSLVGCGDDATGPDADAGIDVEADVDDGADGDEDGGMEADVDGGADGDEDGGVEADVDGGADGDEDGGDGDGDGGDVPPDAHPRDPVVTECPGPRPPEPATGVCALAAGTGDELLLTGVVLTPGEVLRGGEVLIDGNGDLACVGCDCGAAADATRLDCLHGVISPGLINAHDHITYVNNQPYGLTPERFEHRHHWRMGTGGHTELRYDSGANRQELLWGELRMVLGGATSLNGAGSTPGFLRNLDRDDQEGLGAPEVEYSTFPLDDLSGTLLVDSCAYGDIETAASIADENAYTPHIAEGINRAAENEFRCVRQGATDLVQAQSAFIHGVGLEAIDVAEMAVDGTDLIWSPRTNVTLYGDTARLTLYQTFGVRVALGTDWIISGSMNMLRELRCADQLNSGYMLRDDGWPWFSDEELWLMATRDAAHALGVGDRIGTLAAGQAADLAIFDGRVHLDHRAVIDADPPDVVLVLRRSEDGGGSRAFPLFGDAALVAGLPGGSACDPLDVCGVAKAACVSRESGGTETLASLQVANAALYPLFFCGEPDGEPSCLPWRDAAAPWPNPEVGGSNRYTGESSLSDLDGDGINNTLDLCPSIFDPIRPMDGGRQADFDRDGVGDSCDPCPLHPDTAVCSLPPPEDLDADGTPTLRDNCPRLSNPDQADLDGDGKGDPCDNCPDAPNPGTDPCPATIYDIKRPGGPYPVGSRVAVTGALVTAVGSNGFFLQVDPASAGYAGPQYSGVFVYTNTTPTVSAGNRVDLTAATVGEYNCQVQLTTPTVVVTAAAVPLPTPAPVTTGAVRTDGALVDAYEGVLVRVSGAAVTDASPAPCGRDSGANEWEASDGTAAEAVRVDDWLYEISPLPAAGERFASITGVLALRHCCAKLLPRAAGDVAWGAADLGSFGPALSYARAGTTALTFPEPLTVALSRLAAADTTVTFTTSGPGLVVRNVVIPAGTLSVPVPVEAGTAAALPYTVTATAGGVVLAAQVRVLGPAEVPALADLRPATALVAAGGTLDLTVELDRPAPAGGTAVGLAATRGVVPATVVVPADRLTATFVYTAPAAAGPALVTATLGSGSRSSTIDVRDGSPGWLVLNELDYDTVGTDNAEFVELFNAGWTPAALDGLAVVMVNGADTVLAEYRRFDLSGTLGPGEFLVLAGAAVTVPAGVASIALPNDAVQNGAPDGLALFDTRTLTILDALCYEGALPAVSIDGGGTYSLVEGTPTAAADNNASVASLIRLPDGADANNAVADWSVTTRPTPGAPNVP